MISTFLIFLYILALLGILFYIIKQFDKNRYYFMPLYTPSQDYFYPQWNPEHEIKLEFNNDTTARYNLYGYSTTPIKQILPSDVIILYMHGNAGNIYLRIPKFLGMRDAFNARYADGNNCITERREHVLIGFDYRGFGLSSGAPTSEGILEDGIQIMSWCRSTFPNNKIVLYGESIGSSVVAYIVSKSSRMDGIILKSPFASMHSLVCDMFHLPIALRYLVRNIIPDDFLTAEWLDSKPLRNKEIPLVILHNKDDELIPTRNIQVLLDKYKSFIIEGSHNDCDIEGAWLNGCCHVLDKI